MINSQKIPEICKIRKYGASHVILVPHYMIKAKLIDVNEDFEVWVRPIKKPTDKDIYPL